VFWGESSWSQLCDHSLGLTFEFATSLFDTCMEFFVVDGFLGSELVLVGTGW
jgi:hypothetical protein